MQRKNLRHDELENKKSQFSSFQGISRQKTMYKYNADLLFFVFHLRVINHLRLKFFIIRKKDFHQIQLASFCSLKKERSH